MTAKTPTSMSAEIRALGPADLALLERCAEGVFDDSVDAGAAVELLGDPRHHLVVAIDDGVVVGFVSAVHTVHPDDPRPEMWINEVSVAATHRRRGLGRAMLGELYRVARALGCSEAWVLTERSNAVAMALYAGLGGEEDPGDTVMFTFPFEQGEG